MWILFWIGFLLVGIATLLPLYAGLLIDVKEYNRKEFEEIGSPQLFMISPARGLRLQRSIYVGSRAKDIHPIVRKKSLLLGIVTPVYVVLVFLILFWAVRMELSALR